MFDMVQMLLGKERHASADCTPSGIKMTQKVFKAEGWMAFISVLRRARFFWRLCKNPNTTKFSARRPLKHTWDNPQKQKLPA